MVHRFTPKSMWPCHTPVQTQPTSQKLVYLKVTHRLSISLCSHGGEGTLDSVVFLVFMVHLPTTLCDIRVMLIGMLLLEQQVDFIQRVDTLSTYSVVCAREGGHRGGKHSISLLY